MTCGDTVLVYPPVGFNAPVRPLSPEAQARHNTRMARIKDQRAQRRKAMGAPPENKAILYPPEDK